MPASENIDELASVDGREGMQAEIAQRAYEIYESRGRIEGADVDDWLQAEREVTTAS